MKRYCYNCINDCGKVRGNLCVIAVAPYAGAWIEIDHCAEHGQQHRVAPYAGAWIEILAFSGCRQRGLVAPYAGAWIEIDIGSGPSYSVPSSLPTRERGLKSVPDGHAIVLPPGRSLRGSVD